jgi:two-component system, chemotaxis family, sensor kinase CheA
MDPRELYKEEAFELLSELENVLLELEKTPTDSELIGRAFRALHTIKGSGAMFGFDDIAAFTHEVETVFDLVRDGKLMASKKLIDLTLLSRDLIRMMLEGSGTSGEGVVQVRTGEIIKALKDLASKKDPSTEKGDLSANPNQAPEGSSGPDYSTAPDSPERMVTYRIQFRPNQDLFANGTNPVPLLNELRSLGMCTIVAHTEPIPLLSEMEPEYCYTSWDIILTTGAGRNAIQDVFIFVEDCCDIKIEVIDQEGSSIDEDGYKKIGDILIARGDLSPEELQKVLTAQKRIGEMLVDAGLVTPEKVQTALMEQEHIRQIR